MSQTSGLPPTITPTPKAICDAKKRDQKHQSPAVAPAPFNLYRTDGPTQPRAFSRPHHMPMAAASGVRSNQTQRPPPSARPSIQIPLSFSFPDSSNYCLHKYLPPPMHCASPPSNSTMRKPPPQFEFSSGATSAGCISGALRRLLCGALRHSTHRDEAGEQAAQRSKPPATPCIVARLMGLDSMPVFPYTPPDSVGRSRSTNSVDSWAGFMCSEKGYEEAPSPRRAVSSSFRDAPAYLRQENEDFLVLSFGPEVSTRKGKSNVGELRDSHAVKKQRRAAERAKDPVRKQLNGAIAANSPNNEDARRKSYRVMNTEDGARGLPAKAAAATASCPRKKEEEASWSSEETSPVSVLDHDDYSIGFNSPASGGHERAKQSSRPKLSSKFEILNVTSSSPHKEKICRNRSTSLLDDPVMENSANYCEKMSMNWRVNWKKICKLTEQDLKNSSWTAAEDWRSEEVCEIVATVAVKILDAVLKEAVSEISKSP